MKESKRLNVQRRRRCFRVSNQVKRNSTRPRLAVFRSNQHMYAQIIDDVAGRTLVSASTRDGDLRGEVAFGGNIAAASQVGKAIAVKALAAGITKVAFDRRLYKYHGRVAAVADAARDAGLDIGKKAEKLEKPVKAEAGKGGKKKEGSAPKAEAGKKK